MSAVAVAAVVVALFLLYGPVADVVVAVVLLCDVATFDFMLLSLLMLV